MQIKFTVPGEPVGKGRPRATIRGGHISMYTPSKTQSYEDLVSFYGNRAMAGREPLGGAVRLEIKAVFGIPQSWTKKRLAAHQVSPEWATKKSDWDNIGKICADSLNHVCWKDDAQVVDARVTKVYGTPARVEVLIESLDQAHQKA